MKEITYFFQQYCPHCVMAREIMEQLMAEDGRYQALTIREIDELRQPELADTYDYWYVPTYYVGDKKLHEGHAEYEDVKRVFDAALSVENG